MAVERFEMGRDRPPQLFRSRRFGRRDLGDRAVHLRNRLLDDEIEQRLLALEMMVEAALQDADLFGDIPDGGGMIALGPEHLRGCRNNVVKRGHRLVVSRSAPQTWSRRRVAGNATISGGPRCRSMQAHNDMRTLRMGP